MKKLNKKLQLNKVTIARLTSDQQSSFYGGAEVDTSCGMYPCGCITNGGEYTCKKNAVTNCEVIVAPVSMNGPCGPLETYVGCKFEPVKL